jgi:signal transduction histidine kinase
MKMSKATDWNTALQEITQAAARILRVPLVSVAIGKYEAPNDWSRATISSFDENGAVAGARPGAVGFSAGQAATEEEWAAWATLPLRQTRGLVNRLLRNRPILVVDIQKSRIFSEAAKPAAAKHGLQAYFGAPILLRPEADAPHTPFALLSFYLRAPSGFELIETNWLQALTAQAAQVLEYVRLYQQVRRNQTVAENLMRSSMEALENFVYVISHNLKAPIVSIQGFSEILQEELGPTLAPEHRHFLERLRKNAALMEKMILDLLEFSRLGHTPVKFGPVNLKDLVQGVVDEIRLLGQAPDAEFLLPRPVRLYADAAELKTVFENLLNNAVKYRRPEAPLRIEIGWEELPRFHVLWVRDNGVGWNQVFKPKHLICFNAALRSDRFRAPVSGLPSFAASWKITKAWCGWIPSSARARRFISPCRKYKRRRLRLQAIH